MGPTPGRLARSNSGPDSSELTACMRDPQRVRTWWLSFTDRGRGFYALVALGHDAPVVRRDQALRVLDSLRFDSVPRGRDAPEAR